MKLFGFTLVWVLVCLVPPVQAQHADDASEKALVVRAGTVLTMDGEALRPGQVLIRNGKVAEVGEAVSSDGAELIELGPDSVLMPGLINAYSQLGLGNDGSDEVTREVSVDFRAVESIDWQAAGMKRLRATGTTTVAMSPGRENVFSGSTAIVKSAPGPEAVLVEDGALVINLCNDPTAGNRSRTRPDSIYIRQPTNRMGVVWIMRNTFDKAKREKPSELQPVIEVLEGKKPLMVFSRLTHDLRTVATLQDEFGFKPILVGGEEAYKEKDLLIERKYPIILEATATGAVNGEERSELCWNNAGILHDAGLTIAFSGADLLEQARFAVRHGLAEEVALAAITTTPAKILGIEERVGKIAVGYDADLVALSGAPLELTTSVRWVMVDGQLYQVEKE